METEYRKIGDTNIDAQLKNRIILRLFSGKRDTQESKRKSVKEITRMRTNKIKMVETEKMPRWKSAPTILA